MIKCDQIVIFNLDTIKFPKLDPLILDIFQEQQPRAAPCVLYLISSPLLTFFYTIKNFVLVLLEPIYGILETPQ